MAKPSRVVATSGAATPPSCQASDGASTSSGGGLEATRVDHHRAMDRAPRTLDVGEVERDAVQVEREDRGVIEHGVFSARDAETLGEFFAVQQAEGPAAAHGEIAVATPGGCAGAAARGETQHHGESVVQAHSKPTARVVPTLRVVPEAR